MHGAMCDYTGDIPIKLALLLWQSEALLSVSYSQVSASLKASLPPFQTLQAEVAVSPTIFSQLSVLTFMNIYTTL